MEQVNADHGVAVIGDAYYIIDPGTLELLKIVEHNCAPYPICCFE